MTTKHIMKRDARQWRIISDYLANDPEPYTTAQLFEYAKQRNHENANDPEWNPFQLVDRGDRILDLSHQRGNDGHVAAVPYNVSPITAGPTPERRETMKKDIIHIPEGQHLPVYPGQVAEVTDGGEAEVFQGGYATVKQGGNAEVRGGNAYVYDGGEAEVFQGGYATVKQGGNAVVRGGHAIVLRGGNAEVRSGEAYVCDGGYAEVRGGNAIVLRDGYAYVEEGGYAVVHPGGHAEGPGTIEWVKD